MPGNMRPLLPRPLLVLVAALGLLTLVFGEYLEWRQGSWLQAHPITANLISSIIGFSTVTLVVGVGFTIYSNRVARETYLQDIAQAVARTIANRLTTVNAMTSPDTDPTDVIRTEAGSALLWTYTNFERERRRARALHQNVVQPFAERFLDPLAISDVHQWPGLLEEPAPSKRLRTQARDLYVYYQGVARLDAGIAERAADMIPSQYQRRFDRDNRDKIEYMSRDTPLDYWPDEDGYVYLLARMPNQRVLAVSNDPPEQLPVQAGNNWERIDVTAALPNKLPLYVLREVTSALSRHGRRLENVSGDGPGGYVMEEMNQAVPTPRAWRTDDDFPADNIEQILSLLGLTTLNAPRADLASWKGYVPPRLPPGVI